MKIKSETQPDGLESLLRDVQLGGGLFGKIGGFLTTSGLNGRIDHE